MSDPYYPQGPGYPPPPPPRKSSGTNWVVIGVVVAVLAALVIIPIVILASNNGPKGWLEDHYSKTGGDEDTSAGLRFTSDDAPEQTVAAIVKGTDPSERRQEGSTYFLRYKSDWLVTVEGDSTGSGSEIKLYEFDAGYRSHGSTLFFWSSHYQRGGSFRGGGSGSGK